MNRNPINKLIATISANGSDTSKQVVELVVPALDFAEKHIASLDSDVLERTFQLAWKSGVDFKAYFDDVVTQKRTLEMGLFDFEQLASKIYVPNAEWCELFAVKIPNLSNKFASRSKQIARRLFCILYLEQWYKGAIVGESSARINFIKVTLFG